MVQYIIGGNMSTDGAVLDHILKAPTYSSLFQQRQLSHEQIYEAITDNLKMHPDRDTLETLLKEEEFFNKMQKYLELQKELSHKIAELQQKKPTNQGHSQKIEAVNKKITRAALARRHEKNQEEMRKDQIFVRLVPKSQSCIQFMLCNRNFPRMEVKQVDQYVRLSCNQHLEYLVNYLTNKWIRGKVGYKVVLYPDSSFLKSVPLSEKEKVLKEPFNNYLMFTDIMNCCNVTQNGVLNMAYEIVENKKGNNKNGPHTIFEHSKPNEVTFVNVPGNEAEKVQVSSSHALSNKPKNDLQLMMGEKSCKPEEKHENSLIKNSPVKYSYRDDFLPDCTLFNKNSNFFNNEESMFGSLGFNFNFGINKKDDHLFSLNSNNFFDSYFPDIRKPKQEKPEEQKEHHFRVEEDRLEDPVDQNSSKLSQRLKAQQIQVKREKSHSREKGSNRSYEKENSRQKQNQPEKMAKQDPDKKLGTLMNILDQIEKQKDPQGQQQQLGVGTPEEGNNSNRFKDVKTVSIVKKRAGNN